MTSFMSFRRAIYILAMCASSSSLTMGQASPPEHPLGEWYLVGRAMAQESNGIFKAFQYDQKKQIQELTTVLIVLGVQISELRTEDSKMLKQGWSDFIHDLPAAYSIPADQNSSKVVAELQGFHKFNFVVGQSGQLSPDDIERLQAGVVRIKTETGHGSGFFITKDYILTNKHVVDGFEKVKISNDIVDVELIGTVAGMSKDFDIAIVKMENADLLDRISLEIGDSRPVKTGEDISLFGYPIDPSLTVTTTFGRISAKRMHPTLGEIFQLSGAEANPGNSGGPLVDNRGQVIGILTARLTHFKGSEVHGFTYCLTVQQAENLISRFCPEALKSLK
jgi:S1-C subfamily serine protease